MKSTIISLLMVCNISIIVSRNAIKKKNILCLHFMTGIPRRWILDEYRRPFLCPIRPIVVWNLWHLLRDAASTVDNVDTEPYSVTKILCRLGQIIRRVYSWQHCAHLCRRSGWCYWWSWLHKGGLLLQKSRNLSQTNLIYNQKITTGIQPSLKTL